MSANEIVERMAAGCWMRIQPVSAISAAFAEGTVGFRSSAGIKTARVLTIDDFAKPMLIVELEQPQNRRETIVHCNGVTTVHDELRFNYPPDQLTVLHQPMHMDWLGPDLSNPVWLPFQTNPGTVTVPDGYDLDLYNAIAIYLNAGEGITSIDVMLSVWKLPRAEGSSTSLLLPIISVGP